MADIPPSDETHVATGNRDGPRESTDGAKRLRRPSGDAEKVVTGGEEEAPCADDTSVIDDKVAEPHRASPVELASDAVDYEESEEGEVHEDSSEAASETHSVGSVAASTRGSARTASPIERAESASEDEHLVVTNADPRDSPERRVAPQRITPKEYRQYGPTRTSSVSQRLRSRSSSPEAMSYSKAGSGRYAPKCEPSAGEDTIVGDARRSLNAIRARWAKWELEGKGQDRCQSRYVPFAQHAADHTRAMREKHEYAARKERRPKLRFIPPIPCPLFDGETPGMYEIALQLWFKSKGETLVGPAESPEIFRSKRCNYAVARLHGRVDRKRLESAIHNSASPTHVLERYIKAAEQQATDAPGTGAARVARPRTTEPLAPTWVGRTRPTVLETGDAGRGPDARGSPRSHSAERCLEHEAVGPTLAEGKYPDCGHPECGQKWSESAGIALASLRRSLGKSRERFEEAELARKNSETEMAQLRQQLARKSSEAEVAQLRQPLAVMEGCLQVVMSVLPTATPLHVYQRQGLVPNFAAAQQAPLAQYGSGAAPQHPMWAPPQPRPAMAPRQGWTLPTVASLGQLVEEDPPYESWPSPHDEA